MKIKTKNIFKVVLSIGIISFFSGCTTISRDGGFFKSVDGGINFKQGNGETESILAGKNILSLEINLSNDKEIFVGTQSAGLFKSVDEGATWLSDVNDFRNITDIELIPNTQVIYMVAKKNGRGKLFKSDNNGEAWNEIYTEKDEIQGYFPKGRDSVFYECTLTVTDKKTKPVTLELNITIHNYVFEFPEKKIFTKMKKNTV